MIKLTKEDENNLTAVFNYARQAVVNNKQELIGVLNFEEQLMNKLFPKETFTEKTTKALQKKK